MNAESNRYLPCKVWQCMWHGNVVTRGNPPIGQNDTGKFSFLALGTPNIHVFCLLGINILYLTADILNQPTLTTGCAFSNRPPVQTSEFFGWEVIFKNTSPVDK